MPPNAQTQQAWPYTDENGKPKDKFKPVLLAAPERGEIVDGGPVLNIIKFRSFEKHPNKTVSEDTANA